MHRFANPTRFLRIANALLPWFVLSTLLLIGSGLYFALFVSPADYQQGETVRIMFVHVPSAWMGLGVYTGLAIASAVALIWKHPLADIAARASAPVGAAFTLICLLTGSLWGKPMWGTWWVWDARLTSMLLLLFLFLGHIALSNAFDDMERGAKSAAVLALVGLVNVPVIKFSVDWWNTLHQPASVVRLDGPAIHSSMLTPLLLMAAGFLALYLTLLILRMRGEIAERKIRVMRMNRAADGEFAAGPAE
tara:strand:+ start:115867 stop:116613 length:747 start_codon:yes stop_codon:yes gene_type:complete